MKRYLTLFILLFVNITSFAQTLQGTVYDAATKKPVPDAFVYLDGTAISTTTDITGQFEIKTYGVINTQLIIHHLSYIPYSIPNPFQQIPEAIYLQVREHQISEAVVTADRFSRAQKMKAFKEQFLGITKAGASCEILNEDDIVISYDIEKQMLTAFSYNPIIVVNHFLGYRILFSLVDFRVQFSNGKIDHSNTKQSFYAVTSSFTDLDPDNKTLQKRREDVYDHSVARFYKNLTSHTLEKGQYKLFHRQNQINPNQYFEIKDSLSLKYVRILPNTELSRSMPGIRINNIRIIDTNPRIGVMTVLYKRRFQTEINFYTYEFFVDEFGNIDAFDKIIYQGQFGELRAGDMLPLDYEPKTP